MSATGQKPAVETSASGLRTVSASDIIRSKAGQEGLAASEALFERIQEGEVSNDNECPTCGAPIGVLATMTKAAEMSDAFFDWYGAENHGTLVDAARAFLVAHPDDDWTAERLVADYEHRV